MTSLKDFYDNTLNGWAQRRMLTSTAFNSNQYVSPLSTMVFGNNKPEWISLSKPEHFEKVARFNPIVKSALDLLATAYSNGNKVLIDNNTGEVIEWNDSREVVRKLKTLFKGRPNPLQSSKEFSYQGVFYLKVFGNRYVYALMPEGFDRTLDVLNVDALYNLPSQFMDVHTTGKMFKQKSIEGIISDYARTNTSPIERYRPEEILHFNEVNFSSEQASVMGISKLESLREPISNIQACFESINTLLVTGGAKGIISIDSKDGQGTIVPLRPDDKREVDKTFKEDYGLLGNQNPFLISPVPLKFDKTAMTSTELGIYEELSSNTIMVGNGFGVPPELLKTFEGSATYENQKQSVTRLYQDTVMPMAEDDDQYWNYRLNLDKYGIRIETRWGHIPALSENEKEKASANNLLVKASLEEYNGNVITWNQYLSKTGQENVSGGDIYKFQRKIGNTTE